MNTRRADVLTALLLAASCAAALSALARVPALTGDEAWVGLFALRLRGGLFTPHEMNTYTGPLYGWLLSKVFAARGVSVETLRLPGACFGAAAFVLAAADLRRRAGAASAAWFAAVLAGSAYLLLKARTAWDIYALQPLLLAGTLALLDGPATFPRFLLFCALTLIGVQNHFIYLSVPVSLCALYGARAAWLGEEDARPWLRLSCAALAMGAVVFLVKPRLSEAAWPAERAWALPLFFALAPAAALASLAAWEGPLIRLLRRGERVIKVLTACGLAAFAVWHLVPLWQALGDRWVWMRTLSWRAPWWLSLPLGAWAAFLLALLVWRAVRAWHGHEPMTAHQRTLALWPAAYAAVFIVFRNTSSFRYYSVIQFLSLAALGPALASLPRPDRRYAAGFAAFAVLAAQGVLWRELAAPGDRPPLFFKIGWHAESSRDYLRKDALFAAYDASNACGLAHLERSFVQIPVQFHQLARGTDGCDPSKTFDADVCPDCAAPPFYRWTVTGAPR